MLIEGYAPKIKSHTSIQLIETNAFDPAKVKTYNINIENGKFSAHIPTGKGDQFVLKMADESHTLYLELGRLEIYLPDSTLKKLVLKNNRSADENEQYAVALRNQPIYKKLYGAQVKWFAANSQAESDAGKKIYDSVKTIYDQQVMEFNFKWIKAHPLSYINSARLFYMMNSLTEEQTKTIFEQLNADAKGNNIGRYLRYRIDSLFIGQTAPDFKQADTAGNMVDLYSFRGKYVLIDFWASWCLPCRADNPNLVKAMQKLGNGNFTILSVSLDSKRNSWLEAIKKDQLNWTHVSDLKEWKNAVSVKYGIHSIPDNFLLDPEGKIIGRRISGTDLPDILQQVRGEKRL